MKILWWDQDGYAMYYKRLERGTFVFPVGAGDGDVAIDSAAVDEAVERVAGGKTARTVDIAE